MATLNKSKLIEQVESRSDFSKETIETVLELLMEEIGSGLSRSESVSLSGYGVFVPRVQKMQREGQSGSTSWWREDAGHTTVLYKPGKDMLDLVNRKSANRKVSG